MKINFHYLDLNHAFCSTRCIKNDRNNCGELRLPATSGRLKIVKSNQIDEATYLSGYTKLKTYLHYLDVYQAFCYSGYIKTKRNSFQDLRLPATSGREKIGQQIGQLKIPATAGRLG